MKHNYEETISTITWVIPVYNGEKYIGQAIKSILSQPCKDLKLIIVDDGSTDHTATIVKGIADDRIQYIYQKNSGVSIARNTGIKSSNSKYIAFLDADDILCRNIYNKELYELLKSSDYDLLSFSYFNADENLKRGNLQKVETGEFFCEEQKPDCFKHISSFIFRRKLFDDNPSLMFPEGIKCREDVAFLFFALCCMQRGISIDRNIFIYRNNRSSVSHSFATYDYFIDHAVPAWYWCKQHCSRSRDINECDARLFADATDYIKYSCMYGKKIDEIQRKLRNPMIQEAVRNYDELWNGRKEIYEQFEKCPKKYSKNMRKKGYMEKCIKWAMHIPIVRWCYQRIKYTMDIRSFV